MGEVLMLVLWNKKDFFMCCVIEFVESGEVNVCVSVGNIGVLFILLFYLFKILLGIDRFVFINMMFIIGYYNVFFLDLGVNVNCMFEIFF